MITLVITLCLLSNPTQCKTEFPAVELSASPTACPLAGQRVAAAMVEEDPRWRVQDIRCVHNMKRLRPT